jgi:hypothetical protein
VTEPNNWEPEPTLPEPDYHNHAHIMDPTEHNHNTNCEYNANDVNWGTNETYQPQWSSCFEMVCQRSDAPWQIVNKKKEKEVKMETTSSIQSGFVAAQGSVPVKSEQKRKLEAENLSVSVKKRKTAQMIIVSNNSSSPPGLIGDGDDYSCAYDALLTILY